MTEEMSQREPKMIANISCRVDEQLIIPLSEFVHLTGVTQTRIVNECIDIALPVLEERRKAGKPLVHRRVDPPKDPE